MKLPTQKVLMVFRLLHCFVGGVKPSPKLQSHAMPGHSVKVNQIHFPTDMKG